MELLWLQRERMRTAAAQAMHTMATETVSGAAPTRLRRAAPGQTGQQLAAVRRRRLGAGPAPVAAAVRRQGAGLAAAAAAVRPRRQAAAVRRRRQAAAVRRRRQAAAVQRRRQAAAVVLGLAWKQQIACLRIRFRGGEQ